MLTIIIAGIVTGSIYGLAGVGLILTYKTSGIFNLAHGALATVSAFLFYTLRVQAGVPWPIAAAICVLVAGPMLGLAFEFMGRLLATGSLVVKTVATVGVLLIVQGLALIIYGTTSYRFVPQFLPGGTVSFLGATVTVSDLIVIAISLTGTGALIAFFRFARMGVAMRAVVDNPDLVGLAATSPQTVRRWAWVIGIVFASASGVLLAPLISSLDATTLTLLVVQAFGAAAIGEFVSLPRTYIGGIIVGVAAAVATREFKSGLLSGLPSALPFLILFAVLLFASRKRLAENSVLRPPSRSTWTTPWQFQVIGGVILLVVLIFVPSFASFHLDDYTLFLTTTMLLLSLGLLVKTSGQVSLAHVAFTAIGACAMSHFAVGLGIPWALSLLAAGAVAIPVGALLAIPAIRLSGLYLMLATFGFGVLLSFMFYTASFMFGSNFSGLTLPRPTLSWLDIASDSGYYRLVLVLTALTTLAVIAINRSRLGRLLRALADSPTGLATSGTSVNVTRVLVFCISAFLASISGALTAVSQQIVTGATYTPLLSLTYFALVVISPGNVPWYAIMGAAGYTLIPSYFPAANTANYLTVFFGVAAIAYAVTPEDLRGAAPLVQRLLNGLASRLPQIQRRRTQQATLPSSLERAPVGSGLLQASGLRVRFGGLTAVDNVSFTVRTGHITGLIGPNGAGKTTTFNACCGLNTPSDGTVQLDARNLGRLGPAARARRGLGRTFQQMELFDTLTVHQNVAMGMEGSFAGANPLSHLLSFPAQRRKVSAAADESMTLCGITDLADRVVGSLSTGQRRLVELARCLAGEHRLLLLDEPSSGLDRTETERFGEVLKRTVSERGVGILLVEHDMSLVREVCDYLYVLDFGKPIFDGDVALAMSSSVVRAAYLGDDSVEAAVGAVEEK